MFGTGPPRGAAVARARGVAWVALALAVAGAAGPAAAQEQDDVLSAEERAWLDAHGPLRVAFSPTGPPFELQSADGRYVGINADILALITVKTGIQFDISRPSGFPPVYAGIANGTYDAFAIAVHTADREAELDWTEPYAWARTGFWTTTANADVGAPSDLNGRVVVLVNNAVHPAFINETFPEMQPLLVRNAKEAVERLAAGDADGLYGGHANTGYYVRSLGLSEFRTVGEATVNEVRFGVKDGNEPVLSILNKALGALERDDLLAIYVKWTGQDMGPPVTVASGAVLTPMHKGLLAGAGGLVLVLGVGTVVLRMQVAARTRELAALNATLERKVRERTAELNERNDELQVFNSAVSHDLRTKLTAASGFTRILRATRAKAMDDEGQRYLARLDATHERMGRLVEDILRLSRATRGPLHREPVDAGLIAREVIDMLAEEAPERNVETAVANAMRFEADAGLLRVALENLIGNAWKFTLHTPSPRIEVGVRDTPRGRALFVRDNGAGFDPARASSLFEPFARLHDEQEFAGTGLGLATVRRVAQRHGGEAWAESRPGEGATFYLSLGGDAP